MYKILQLQLLLGIFYFAMISTACSIGENYSCPTTSDYYVHLTCCRDIISETVKVIADTDVMFTCNVDISGVSAARLCFEPTVNSAFHFTWVSQVQSGTYLFKNFPREYNGTRIACVITDDTGQNIRSDFLTVIVVDEDGNATTLPASTPSSMASTPSSVAYTPSSVLGDINPTKTTRSSGRGLSATAIWSTGNAGTTESDRDKDSKSYYWFIAIPVVVILFVIVGLVGFLLYFFREKVKDDFSRHCCGSKTNEFDPGNGPTNQDCKKTSDAEREISYDPGSQSTGQSSEGDSRDGGADNFRFGKGMQDEQSNRQSQTVVPTTEEHKARRMRPLTKTDRGANGGEDCTQDIKVEVEQVLPREESASCRIDPAQKNSGLLVQTNELVTGISKTLEGESKSEIEFLDENAIPEPACCIAFLKL